MFSETASQRNYASKSLSQALLLGKPQARDAYAAPCLLLALTCESAWEILQSPKVNANSFSPEQYAAVIIQPMTH